jgi:hypothetical protein
VPQDSYPSTRAIRQVPAALLALLNRAGLPLAPPPTPEGADEMARLRATPIPTDDGGSNLLRGAHLLTSAIGAYPLPGESHAQFMDAMEPPEQYFPTRALAQRARGITPKDVTLPDEGPNTAARWQQYAKDLRK